MYFFAAESTAKMCESMRVCVCACVHIWIKLIESCLRGWAPTPIFRQMPRLSFDLMDDS